MTPKPITFKKESKFLVYKDVDDKLVAIKKSLIECFVESSFNDKTATKIKFKSSRNHKRDYVIDYTYEPFESLIKKL